MNERIICDITGATNCEFIESIQELWSGYGTIDRVALDLEEYPTAIVKHIDVSTCQENRRGWGGGIAHQRKVRSYQVERRFYESYGKSCGIGCRIPRLIAAHEIPEPTGWLIVLEDLDAAGFDLRKTQVSTQDLNACVSWLAHFHGTFLNGKPEGLWPIGTYWHLDTRPDEFKAMTDGPLKSLASVIDQRLNNATFQTFVHGDAKVANFCFSKNGAVAAVDFQYIGSGCGMKDLAYLISSCLTESEAESQWEALLDFYFAELFSLVQAIDFDELQTEWRSLFPFAVADFHRFLAGWSPGHWKMNRFSDRMTQWVLDQLE